MGAPHLKRIKISSRWVVSPRWVAWRGATPILVESSVELADVRTCGTRSRIFNRRPRFARLGTHSPGRSAMLRSVALLVDIANDALRRMGVRCRGAVACTHREAYDSSTKVGSLVGKGRFRVPMRSWFSDAGSTPRRVMAVATVLAIVTVAGVVVAPRLPAVAEVSSVEPPEGGTLEPGQSTTFSVSTDASCLRASGDSDTYEVAVDVAGLCGTSGTRSIVVSVVTTGLTPPGPHTVTVSETGRDGDDYNWTFVVAELDSTTTTTEPTTSTVADTTTTPPTTERPPVASTSSSPADAPPSTVGPDRDADDPPPSEGGPVTSTTDEEPTPTTQSTTPDNGDEAGSPPQRLDPPESIEMRRPDFSGLASDDFMALFGDRSEAALDGLRPGLFERLFGGDDREQETPDTQTDRTSLPLIALMAVVVVCVFVASVLGVRRRTG